jgi:hypothetical protein
VAYIISTRGREFIIDSEDLDRVLQFWWGIYWPEGYNDWHIMRRSPNHIYLWRFLLEPPDNMEIDHINHDRLDNRKQNLRLATKSQNHMNRRKRNGTTSEYKGVYWSKHVKKWRAYGSLNQIRTYLGYFNSELDAAKAYDAWALYTFKEYALLNF